MQRPIRVRPRPGEGELRASEWLLFFGALLAALLICGGGFWQLQRSMAGALSGPPTATPRPTWTPSPRPSPTPPAPTPTPTLPAAVQVGIFVKVSGAGEQGLSFRRAPSLQAERIRFLPEGTIMRVVGGPEEADGLTWWQLEDPRTGERGWAAGAYLTPSYGP